MRSCAYCGEITADTGAACPACGELFLVPDEGFAPDLDEEVDGLPDESEPDR